MKIYHRPTCSTSRYVLNALREKGIEPEIVLYTETPPSREELIALGKDSGLGLKGLLRTKEPQYKALGLGDADDEAILDALAEHPILLERPIVRDGARVLLARPKTLIEDWLA